MIQQIFVNLPVKYLRRSIDFFTKLGFTFNPQFTDENATCMIIGENMFAMLIVEKFFPTFTQKEMADSQKYTEVITSLQVDTRKEVDEIIDKALKNGAQLSAFNMDTSWMYSKGFSDLDGHMWEFFFMDLDEIKKETPQ
jgi:predicted lactoylglutathione lyase